MEEYTLRGEAMTDRASAWNHLGEVLGLESGLKSLDGLWEGLCALPVPFRIHVTGWSAAEAGLEDFADELMEMLGDLVEEEEEFSFDVTD